LNKGKGKRKVLTDEDASSVLEHSRFLEVGESKSKGIVLRLAKNRSLRMTDLGIYHRRSTDREDQKSRVREEEAIQR
jgi:hypothetical protein